MRAVRTNFEEMKFMEAIRKGKMPGYRPKFAACVPSAGLVSGTFQEGQYS